MTGIISAVMSAGGFDCDDAVKAVLPELPDANANAAELQQVTVLEICDTRSAGESWTAVATLG